MEKFTDLKNAFAKQEPKNGDLYYAYSKLFARIAGRKKEILNQANLLITKAIQLQPENSDFNTELGY